jgi:nucleoside phosphorylase
VTDLAFHDPCIVFALRREARPFLRDFRPQQRFPGAPCWARFCGPSWLSVLVLETGVGHAAMEVALTWLLGQPLLGGVPYRPRVVLSAGFSGGLCDGLKVGDLILATEVADQNGYRWTVPWPGELPPGEWRPPLHRGRLLSVATLLTDPAEKQRLGQQHEALAVDMETATVARLCREHGIPFGCVRAISDDVRTPLSPRLLSLLAGGRVAPHRVVAALFRWPRMAGELWRLEGQTRFAAGQLAVGLGELLTLTLPWASV